MSGKGQLVMQKLHDSSLGLLKAAANLLEQSGAEQTDDLANIVDTVVDIDGSALLKLTSTTAAKKLEHDGQTL